jgi:NMD protein affecting ribosome stability and mRNA decay
MHRPGADPNAMEPGDFLCDFCGRAWDGTQAMVEGHRGSLICGSCLAVAYRVLVVSGDDSLRGRECTLCLETRDQSEWVSPASERAVVCERCVRQAAQAMEKDAQSGWTRPGEAPRVSRPR